MAITTATARGTQRGDKITHKGHAITLQSRSTINAIVNAPKKSRLQPQEAGLSLSSIRFLLFVYVSAFGAFYLIF